MVAGLFTRARLWFYFKIIDQLTLGSSSFTEPTYPNSLDTFALLLVYKQLPISNSS
jgi:hypothetical protein